jgi:hypothetical protein
VPLGCFALLHFPQTTQPNSVLRQVSQTYLTTLMGRRYAVASQIGRIWRKANVVNGLRRRFRGSVVFAIRGGQDGEHLLVQPGIGGGQKLRRLQYHGLAVNGCDLAAGLFQ